LFLIFTTGINGFEKDLLLFFDIGNRKGVIIDNNDVYVLIFIFLLIWVGDRDSGVV
jgi:hypothetical protein